MLKSISLTLIGVTLLAAGAAMAQETDLEQLREQVEETERAFARTMADRDHGAFASFLSGETIFFAGESPLRGKQTVADAWKPFFEGPEPPFSWEPVTVEVLDSGTLALSSGPVRDPSGAQVGVFNSIWRLDPEGNWKIIFDKGGCPCQRKAPADDG